MALSNVTIPLYDSAGENKNDSLLVNEFAGRIRLTINATGGLQATVECYFDDLWRAWNAVKRSCG